VGVVELGHARGEGEEAVEGIQFRSLRDLRLDTP
jgi:hypothetical protein